MSATQAKAKKPYPKARRTMNAWFWFLDEKRAEKKAELIAAAAEGEKVVRIADVTKALAAVWKMMDVDAREPYLAKETAGKAKAPTSSSSSAYFATKRKLPREKAKLEVEEEQQAVEVVQETKTESTEDGDRDTHTKRQKVGEEDADQKGVQLATVGRLPPAYVASEPEASSSSSSSSSASSSSAPAPFVLNLSGAYKKATARDADIFGKSNWTTKHFLNCPCCE